MADQPPLSTKDDVHAFVQHELERELASEMHKRKMWRAAEWVTLGVLFVLALLQYLFIETMYRALVSAEPQGRMMFRGSPHHPGRQDTRFPHGKSHALGVILPSRVRSQAVGSATAAQAIATGAQFPREAV